MHALVEEADWRANLGMLDGSLLWNFYTAKTHEKDGLKGIFRRHDTEGVAVSLLRVEIEL